jgi:phenylacetate-CoA ligase
MLSATERVLIRVFLIPIDRALLFIGPRYSLYFWFFSVTPPSWIAWLGKVRAVRAADHAMRKVPAYRSFLKANGTVATDINRLKLPATDKANYVTAYSPEERSVGGRLRMTNTAIDESSGSTGVPFNWIRSIEERHVSHFFISHFARYVYGREPWITINAFSMGAWATGVNMGAALQRNSIVKNTGPDLDKIFNTLDYFGPSHRYLVCGYPPFLKRMIDEAEDRGFDLSRYRLMSLLGGEGNSEGVRDYLYQRFNPVYSGYGATDIEIGLAGETPLSLGIRRAARDDNRLKRTLFGNDTRLPMIFQYNPLMHHIEVNGQGELIFTISRLHILTPRIRYNIHDEGGVATYKEMATSFREAGRDLFAIDTGSDARHVRMPFLWVFGRKDSTVSVMGANIYPEDIEECLYANSSLARVTRSFCLGLKELPGGVTRPLFSFEVVAPPSAELVKEFTTSIVERLRSLNADFREAFSEYEDAVTPVVELYAPGCGPFAHDSRKIKQTRMLKHGDGTAV